MSPPHQPPPGKSQAGIAAVDFSNRPATPGDANNSATTCSVRGARQTAQASACKRQPGRDRARPGTQDKMWAGGPAIRTVRRTPSGVHFDAAQVQRPRKPRFRCARANVDTRRGSGARRRRVHGATSAAMSIPASAVAPRRTDASPRPQALPRRRSASSTQWWQSVTSAPIAQNQSPRRLSTAATTSRPRGTARAIKTDVVERPAAARRARRRGRARRPATHAGETRPTVTAISDSSFRRSGAAQNDATAGNSRAAGSRPPHAGQHAPSRTTATPSR
jgi:hypothetical protein